MYPTDPATMQLAQIVAQILQSQGLPGGSPGLMNVRSPRLDQLADIYREVLRQANVAFDGLVIPRPRIITLGTTLSGSTLTGNATFNTPSDEILLIHEMRGHMLLNVPHSETAGFGALVSTAVSELINIKAAATTIALSLNGSSTPVTLGSTLCLGDILPGHGTPMRFDIGSIGWVIPPSSQLICTPTLVDASVIGQSTDYGVVLMGVGLQLPGKR